MPVWALRAGKKPHMTPVADETTDEVGCKPQSQPAVSGEPNGRVTMMSPNGTTTTFEIGPGDTARQACRNITMARFTEALRGMFGANLNQSPVLDKPSWKGDGISS